MVRVEGAHWEREKLPGHAWAWPESGTKLHVHVGGALCAFHRHSSMVNTHHGAGPIPLALGCSGASVQIRGGGRDTFGVSSLQRKKPSDTEVTQGVLCSAASAVLVSAYERLFAHFYLKSLQAREGPGNPV